MHSPAELEHKRQPYIMSQPDEAAKLLTASQLDIYGAQQIVGDKPVYNMPIAFRLVGPLQESFLEEALTRVVREHGALRSAVINDGDDVRQIQRPFPFTLVFHETPDRKTSAETIRHALARPFKLGDESPFRADLFRVAPEEHILLIQMHHLFGDMASLSIICDDLSALYSAVAEGKSDLNLPPSIPLAIEGSFEPNRDDLDFWKENLAECSPDFELPLDKKRPAVPTFNGDVVIHELPESVINGLSQLARELKCSAYTVALAAFEALLYRYAGEQCFSIATPFSDRSDPALERAVGYLSRLLPVVCRIVPNQSFKDFVREVREQSIDAISHSNISFRRLMEHLELSGEGPRPAMMRVVFQYHPVVINLQLTGLRTEPIYLHNGTSKFDLCVSVGGLVGNRSIEFEYDTDLFERVTIERIGRSYQRLLETATKDSSQSLHSLNILSGEDKESLRGWNETSTPYPSNATVHSLFEGQAALHPARIAIRSAAGRQITYCELNDLSHNVASTLRQSGVKPGDMVGVCIKRSPELIAVLLGILKASAAFVPFDASYPKSRLEYLFQDSGVQLLIADEHGRGITPKSVRVLMASELLAATTPENQAAPVASSESAAYMMYTSGSTGNPKGVVVPHRAIVRLVRNNDFMGIADTDIFLAFAPVSFDASTLEIWAPLLNGASLAVYPSEFESAEQFAVVLREHKVTVLWLTAALFNTIVDQDVQSLKGVRQLLVGGDVLSVPHVRKALEFLPNTELINGYGPTEKTTITSCNRNPRHWPPDRSIPIGRPIRNTTVYILDPRLQQVPIGVVGDLYAGGDGLSLGYWRKPDLTQTSFINDPFSTDATKRLYRTGDRARFLPDGNIEFLGRKDAQVKIRGFRIEFGEVESALRTIKGVRDAIAAIHNEDDGSKRLVTYVISETNGNLSGPELLKCAREILPSPAVPSFVVFLNEFPLGPTGKVNRRALPKPETKETTLSSASSPMQPNSIEEKIIAIWRMILGVENVGAEDSFFDLGGESLRATRAVNQLNKAFDCRLAVSSIFMASTAREMADLISSRSRGKSDAKLGITSS